MTPAINRYLNNVYYKEYCERKTLLNLASPNQQQKKQTDN